MPPDQIKISTPHPPSSDFSKISNPTPNIACNELLTPPSKSTTPSLKIFKAPSSLQTSYSPLQLEMVASAFSTHAYFQQAHVYISEAIITD